MSIKVCCFGCSSPLLKFFMIDVGCQHLWQVLKVMIYIICEFSFVTLTRTFYSVSVVFL